MLGEFLQAQTSDRECQATAQTVRLPAYLFPYDHYRVLLRRAAVEGALQNYVPVALRSHVLYPSYYPSLAGHPRERHTYNIMRNHFFCPHMTIDVHATVKAWRSCAQNGSQRKHKRRLEPYPAAGILEFVAAGILGLLP